MTCCAALFLKALGAIALFILASHASAAVVVQFRSSLPGSQFVDVTHDSHVSIDGSNNVTITGPNTGTWRVFSNNPGVESIGVIRFIDSDDVLIDLLLATPANADFTFGVPFSADACVNWAGLDQGSTRTRVQVRCSGNMTGSVDAEHVVRLDAGMSIQGSVIQRDERHVSPTIWAIRTFSNGDIAGSITSVRGAIQLVEAAGSIVGSIDAQADAIGAVATSAGGNLLGDVVSRNATIGSIDISGAIGQAGALRTISARNGITVVQAASIYADVTANRGDPLQPYDALAPGNVTRVQATTGSFYGSLRAYDLLGGTGDGVIVNGALNADVTLGHDGYGPIRAASLGAGMRLRVGRLLASDVAIPGELAGTIDIGENAAAASSFNIGTLAQSGRILIGTTGVNGDLNTQIIVNGTLAGTISIDRAAFPNGFIQAASVASSGMITVGSLCRNAGMGARALVAGQMAGDLTNTGNPRSDLCPDAGIAEGAGITAASFSATSTIAVDGVFRGSIVSTEDQSFAGQLVLNAEGASPPEDSWASTGVVTVGGVTIQPGSGVDPMDRAPYYARGAASIGGGALGLVPFHIHASDCTPPSHSYLTRAQFESTGAIVRYYGPVRQNGASPVIEKKMREMDGTVVWAPCDDAGLFGVTVNPVGMTDRQRIVRIAYTGTSGDLDTGRYRMRIDPTDPELLCDIPGSPAVFVDDCDMDEMAGYYFNIGVDCESSECDGGGVCSECAGVAAGFIDPNNWNSALDCNGNEILDACELCCDRAHVDKNMNCKIDTCGDLGSCPCDFNNDHNLNSQDFFDFLTCFFGGSCPTGNDSDYNNDGVTNSQDFFDFLSCFFTSCG